MFYFLFLYSSEEEEEEEKEEELEEEKEENESESETQSANVNLDEKPVLRPQEENEWTLTCSTVQEWADIVAKFADSKHKSEKVLLKGLRELNAVMPDIFMEKVYFVILFMYAFLLHYIGV